MSKGFIIIIFILLINSCKTQQVLTSNNKPIYEIIFASGFSHDAINVKMNNERVIKPFILSSDGSTGLTSLRLFLIQNGKNYIIRTSSGDVNQEFNNDNQNLELKFIYKGIWYNFIPIKEKGKYIVIDAISGLKIAQHIIEPIFD